MNSLTFVLLSINVGADPLTDLLRQDFRGGKVTEPVFKRVGPTPRKFMKAEAAGLRITLPGEAVSAPVGVSSRLAVHGDFEITLAYQILKVGKPTSGYGAGASLWIAMESPGAVTATLARFVRPREGAVFATDLSHNDSDGKRKHATHNFPANTKAGKLRLVRSGSTLIYLATNGADQAFQELRRDEFGSEPLKAVRVAADTGGTPVEVDVLLTDLLIRAEEMSASPASNRQTNHVIWSIWIIGSVIGAALALVGIIYWRRARRRIKLDKGI